MVKLSRRYFLRILIFTGAFVGIIIQKINILATTFNSAKPKPIMPISNIDEVVEIQVELREKLLGGVGALALRQVSLSKAAEIMGMRKEAFL